jgi:hypothetical protein
VKWFLKTRWAERSRGVQQIAEAEVAFFVFWRIRLSLKYSLVFSERERERESEVNVRGRMEGNTFRYQTIIYIYLLFITKLTV